MVLLRVTAIPFIFLLSFFGGTPLIADPNLREQIEDRIVEVFSGLYEQIGNYEIDIVNGEEVLVGAPERLQWFHLFSMELTGKNDFLNSVNFVPSQEATPDSMAGWISEFILSGKMNPRSYIAQQVFASRNLMIDSIEEHLGRRLTHQESQSLLGLHAEAFAVASVYPELSMTEVLKRVNSSPRASFEALRRLGIRWDNSGTMDFNQSYKFTTRPEARGRLYQESLPRQPNQKGELVIYSVEDFVTQVDLDFAEILKELSGETGLYGQPTGERRTAIEESVELLKRAAQNGVFDFPITFQERRYNIYISLIKKAIRWDRVAENAATKSNSYFSTQLERWQDLALDNGADALNENEQARLMDQLKDFQAELIARVVAHGLDSKQARELVNYPGVNINPNAKTSVQQDLIEAYVLHHPKFLEEPVNDLMCFAAFLGRHLVRRSWRSSTEWVSLEKQVHKKFFLSKDTDQSFA